MNAKNISRRIEQKLGLPSLVEKLSDELSPSDLNSLLTEVFAARVERNTPGDLVKSYAQNQYVKPAVCDAVHYRNLEANMLSFAEGKGIRSIIPSPAALLGCCSAFGAVSQNKIISATRNLEILSDATNMLALHIAAGIKDEAFDHASTPIHLCTTHRHIRYYPSFGEGMLPHFGLFTMVSAGKSRGSYQFEIETLFFHLRFYCDYWRNAHDSTLSVTFSRRAGYKDSDGFFHRVMEAVKDRLPDLEVDVDEEENHTTYYKGLQATLNAPIGGEIIEVGDMGFVDWTQKLLNGGGERLLISAMALDRQLPMPK